MDRKFIIVIIAIIIIGLGSLFFFKKSPPMQQYTPQPNTSATPMMVQQQTPPVTATKTIMVALSSQNNSGESGTATLTDIGGKTNVVIALNGAPTGITQPAHIHTGTCATIGGIKHPLTFPLNGKSETTLDVPLSDLLSQLPLAINIHKSIAESNVFVACGDISDPNTASQNANMNNSQPAASPSPSSATIMDDRRKGADKPED